MLLANNLQDMGDLKGVMYDFEYVGDILPKHIHTDFDNHITIVTRGKLKAYSHDWEQEAIAGQILNFRPREPHELMALEDNTRIINILKKFDGVVNDNRLFVNPIGAPEISMMAVSNVFTRTMNFTKAGDVENGHRHSYDHGTLVSYGSVKVEVFDAPDGVPTSEKVFNAPSMIFIPKDKYHRLTAMQDNTVCACIHALRTIDDNLVDPSFLVEQLDGGNNEIKHALEEKYKIGMKSFNSVPESLS